MTKSYLEKITPSTRTVVFIACISRFIVWLFSYITHRTIQDYDTSSDLLLNDNSTIWNIFGQFIKWDAVYFIGIAENAYKCEQFFAFMPGFPILIRLLGSGIVQNPFLF